MCDDFLEDTTILHSDFVRAAKDHRCMACCETIHKGDRHHVYTSVFEGSVSSDRHCSRCWAICEALWRERGAVSIDLGLDCGETWEEPPEHVAALAFWLPGEPLPTATQGGP